MNKIIEMLNGKKTYLVAIVWLGCVAANLFGFLDGATLSKIELVLLPAGLAALRAGVK